MKKFIALFLGLVFAVGGATAVPAATKYVDAEAYSKPIDLDVREGLTCKTSNYGWPVVGYLKDGKIGFVRCDIKKVFVKSNSPFAIDQRTLKPLIPIEVPAKTIFSEPSMTYIYPKISESQPSSSLSDASLFTETSKCKIAEADFTGRPHMASGFGIPKERASFDGGLNVQVIPVDFADTNTTTKPSVDFADGIRTIKNFYNRMSDGRQSINFRVPQKYLKLPKKSSSYGLGGQSQSAIPAYAAYAREVGAVADASIDFNGVDVALIVHTPKVKDNVVSSFIAEAGMPNSIFAIQSKEKTILNVMIQGNDNPRNLQNWTHEFGHMLGMTDSGAAGSMAFDLMLNYMSPELTVWNRWIMGFELDNQINCVTSDAPSTHWLRPVAVPNKTTEGVVIPLSATQAIIIESRRRTGYDSMLGKESEGAFVYALDTTKSGNGGSNPFTALLPARAKAGQFWAFDAPLKKGESVTFSGWKITNVESGAFGDVVRVEKVG